MDDNFDARHALAAAADSRSRLADRLVTPRWYHPLVGVTLVMICFALGMPEGTLADRTRVYLLAATVPINVLVIPWLHKVQTGVWIRRPTGPRSRRLLRLGVIPFAAIFGVAVGNYLLVGPVWVPVVIGAVAFIGAILCGARYDDAVRADLRSGGEG